MMLGSFVLMKFFSWLCLFPISPNYILFSNDFQRQHIPLLYSSCIENSLGRTNQ